MSAREERCLATILQRLAALSGIERVELGPPDDHGENGTYPAIAIIPGEVEALGEPEKVQLRVVLPVLIRAVTRAAPTEGNGDLPLSSMTAGYALLVPMLAALFPGNTTAAYIERLDGHCQRFRWVGHEVVPREDGGQYTAVYINTEVEYVLNLANPEL